MYVTISEPLENMITDPVSKMDRLVVTFQIAVDSLRILASDASVPSLSAGSARIEYMLSSISISLTRNGCEVA
jgi:hypothetical protein